MLQYLPTDTRLTAPSAGATHRSSNGSSHFILVMFISIHCQHLEHQATNWMRSSSR